VRVEEIWPACQQATQLGVGKGGKSGRVAWQRSSSELGIEDWRLAAKEASPNHPE
jgi:hypothetical protein